MTKLYAINWSIWIGIVVGVYALLYTFSPLYAYGVMPCTFVALPLFFLAGAKKEEFLDFCSSAIAGVIWGLIFLYFIGLLISQGLAEPFANAIIIFAATTVLCAFHFIVTKKVVFSKVPMMFGGIASTFFGGGDKWWVLMITLCFGVLLAFLCQCGTYLLDESGHWKLPGGK
ncbi:DUF1097 domain-containing protein [Lachnospiraceae bacterium ZAX-1]